MSSDQKNVPALDKCFKILDLLAEHGGPLRASDLSKQLALPRSTMHGLIWTLVNHRVLTKSSDGKIFLGPHIMSWAQSFLSQQNLIHFFQEEVTQIEEMAPYTLTLSIRERREVIYLDCRNSQTSLGFFFRPGMQLPAVFTSTGKAMLSTLSDEKLAALFAREWPAPLTQNSTSGLQDFLAEVNESRKRGFAIDNGQIKESMYCIGRAICNAEGEAVAGISISLLKEEFTPWTIKHLAGFLHMLAQRIELRMGNISHT